MPLNLGSNSEPSALYHGNDPVSRVYLGNTQVWPTAVSGLATFATNQWSLTDEPSVSGDVATIDFSALPTEAGYTAEYFEINVNEAGAGGAAEMVLMGPLLNDPRRIRLVSGQSNSAKVRVMWRNDVDDTLTAGAWSPVRTVTPTVGAPVLTLSADRTVGVAPFGTQFRAVLAGSGELRPYHDVRYKWTFPETGNYDALPADFEWSRDRQVDFGPICAFTFETPNATATVTCEATYRHPTTGVSTTVSNTISVQVDDPAVVFAGANTITVGATASGDDYDAADIGVAAFAITSAANGSNRRLSLRRGLTYGDFQISSNFNVSRLAISAHGTGADPIVNNVDLREMGSEITISDMDAVGPYDPADPTGTVYPDFHFEILNAICPVTVHNCRSRGARIAIYGSSAMTVISNCDIADWFDYGVLGNQGSFSFIGSSIKQSPNTLRLNDGKNNAIAPYYADHGPFRTGGENVGIVTFSKNDIFSNSNWAAADQPQNPLRWNSRGAPGSEFYLNMCQIEGGGFGFAAVAASGGTYNPQYVLCERFRHIGTGPDNELSAIGYGGTTFRNFVLVQPNVPAETAGTLRRIMRLGLSDAPQRNGNDRNPVEVYSGALVDLRNEANATAPYNPSIVEDTLDFYSEGEFTLAPVTENNIFFAPNRTGTNEKITQIPLDVAQGRTPNYIGARVGEMVDLTFGAITGPGSTVRSAGTQGLLVGGTSGATANPYGLDIGGQVAARMTSVADFQVGETVTVTFDSDTIGTFVVATVSARNILIPRFTNSAAGTATFAPQSGSSALGAATSGKVALDDWNGTLRETTLAGLARTDPSAGPFEPALEG